VAQSLVVGIFKDSDPNALESALSAQQIDLDKVKVVSMDPPDENDESTQLEFVDVIAEMGNNERSDEMMQGVGVFDETGTGVPGISSGGRQASLDSFSHHEAAARLYFKGFSIPSDEIDNFGDAVAEGRAVVLYSDAGSDLQTAAAALKAAGLRNVRVY
jgi:rhodanese-related sulfurtransferase